MFSKTYILLQGCQTCFSVFSLLQNSLENKSSFMDLVILISKKCYCCESMKRICIL